MGERAIIERGMETLAEIGQGDSTTFVVPQELTSLVGRYGKGLSGSDAQQMEGLEGLEFDDDTRAISRRSATTRRPSQMRPSPMPTATNSSARRTATWSSRPKASAPVGERRL
jgi:hypothetical protein